MTTAVTVCQVTKGYIWCSCWWGARFDLASWPPGSHPQDFWYHIISGKPPWVLTAQPPKIEGGWLHGGGAWMVQLSSCKNPPLTQSWLPGSTVLTCIVALFVLRRGQPNGGECCIMLKRRSTHSLVARLLWFVTCSTQILIIEERCKQAEARCETLLPGLMAPQSHQIDCSYVHELSWSTFYLLHRNLAWLAVTQRT